MSLVTSASIWTNDESPNKKRQSTMRKTIKNRTYVQSIGEPDEYTTQSENYQNLQPSSIDDIQSANQDRNTRVADLLNKITSSDTNDDNSKLGNFKPPSLPALNTKKEDAVDVTGSSMAKPSFIKAANPALTASYGADDAKSGIYSNYNKSYEPPTKMPAPYYASMGLNNGSSDNKLMEKINYMIHLLEEQQHEKTNNITEEFILYTFLGIFIIFVVDSFARAGKYTR
jgi:hypothetical protein